MNMKKTITEKECLRCGFTWFARTDKPKICPYCKTRYWNTPKVRFKKNEVRPKKKEE